MFVADFGDMEAIAPQPLDIRGAMGDAAKATAEKGGAAADYWATAFIELLRDVEAFDLARLR